MMKEENREERYSLEHQENIFDLLYLLAFEIRDTKEKECENSGLNWFNKFRNTLERVRKNLN